MNLQKLKAAIAIYRASATVEQLEAMTECLNNELEAINERLVEIEAIREAEADKVAQQEWKQSEEGKAEAAHFRNAISLWYRTEDQIVEVDGDRRRPNNWHICIEDRKRVQDGNKYVAHKFVGTQEQVIHYVEGMVGTGKFYTPNENKGAKSWRFRWYDYHQDIWLDEALLNAA